MRLTNAIRVHTFEGSRQSRTRRTLCNDFIVASLLARKGFAVLVSVDFASHDLQQ